MSNESEGTPNPLNPGVGSIPSSNNSSPEPLAPVFDEQRISKIRESVTTITLDSPIGLTTPSESPKSQMELAKRPAEKTRPQTGSAAHHHNKRAMDFVRPSKKADSGRMDIVNSPRPHNPGMVKRREHHHPMREADDYYNGEDFKGFREPKEIDDLAPVEEREIVSPPLNDGYTERRTASRITIDEMEEPSTREPDSGQGLNDEPMDEPTDEPKNESKDELQDESKEDLGKESKGEPKDEPVPEDTGDFVPVSDFSANKPQQGPMPPNQQLGVVTNLNRTSPVQTSPSPMKRPMEQAPLPEQPKPKKKHTGLIVGMIISIFLAVGCGVAAVLVLMNNKPDPVAEAFNRIVDGKSPKNVSFNGDASIAITDNTLPIKEMTMTIQGQGDISTLLNSTSVSLDATTRNGGAFSLKIQEKYSANDDFYLKFEGANNVLSDPYLMSSLTAQTTNCAGQADCPSGTAPTGEAKPGETPAGTNPAEAKPEGNNPSASTPSASTPETANAGGSNPFLRVLVETLQSVQSADKEWVKVPANELSQVLPEAITEGQTVKCLSGFVKDLQGNSNSITKLYKENPFVMASKQASQVKSEQYQNYRVVVDNEKFSNFMYAAKEQPVVKNVTSCLGYDGKVLDVEKILRDMLSWPEFYVEVDENYNFTRLFVVGNLQSKEFCGPDETCSDSIIGNTVLDLDFSYPSTIDVSEPTSYRDISEL